MSLIQPKLILSQSEFEEMKQLAKALCDHLYDKCKAEYYDRLILKWKELGEKYGFRYWLSGLNLETIEVEATTFFSHAFGVDHYSESSRKLLE